MPSPEGATQNQLSTFNYQLYKRSQLTETGEMMAAAVHFYHMSAVGKKLLGGLVAAEQVIVEGEGEIHIFVGQRNFLKYIFLKINIFVRVVDIILGLRLQNA